MAIALRARNAHEAMHMLQGEFERSVAYTYSGQHGNPMRVCVWRRVCPEESNRRLQVNVRGGLAKCDASGDSRE